MEEQREVKWGLPLDLVEAEEREEEELKEEGYRKEEEGGT